MPRVSLDYEQNQRKRIIEGAAKVFADYGYRQTTMDQICRTIKLSKGAVYTYFKSKEELFISVMEFIFQQRYMRIASSYEEVDSLTVRFEKIVNCLEDMMDSEHDVYARLSIEGFLESERIQGLQEVKTNYYNHFYTLLLDLLTQGQANGLMNPKLEIHGIVVVMMATLDGLMMHSLVKERQLDFKQIREAVLVMFSQLLNVEL